MKKKHLYFVIVSIAFTFFSCKTDYEKEVENSKRISESLKNKQLASYDDLYISILLKGKEYPDMALLADSIFRNSKKINFLIDSLIEVIEKKDPTGERRDLGSQILVTSYEGKKLNKGAYSLYQNCLKSTLESNKAANMKKRFSKYKGYLGADDFNKIHFSKSSSSYIIMILRGLKVDLSKTVFETLTDIKMYMDK